MKKLIVVAVFAFLIIGTHGFNFQNHHLPNDDIVKIERIDLSELLQTSGSVNVIRISSGQMSYKVTNKNHRDYDLYINANYFTIDDIPIGEVKINGQNITRKNSGGAFFTSNGKTPKFYFNNRPNSVSYSSQTHTPIIINGTPNTKIFNRTWAKHKLPRLVIGENVKGDIFVIHTTGRTGCTVSEFYKISKSQGLTNALMFDGGASIEVGLKYKNTKYHYQIVSDIERKIGNVPTPSVFIVGNFN